MIENRKIEKEKKVFIFVCCYCSQQLFSLKRNAIVISIKNINNNTKQ